jgi:hypothetical protein
VGAWGRGHGGDMKRQEGEMVKVKVKVKWVWWREIRMWNIQSAGGNFRKHEESGNTVEMGMGNISGVACLP